MRDRWVTTTWVAAWSVALSAGTLLGCSDGSVSSSGDGGSGGAAAASSTSSAQGGGSGQASTGSGGSGCGDIQTDPLNCGACNNQCAPGQTCVAGTCTCGTATPAFAADVQPIFTASCALNNCHKPSVFNGMPIPPKAGLDLSPATAYAALVSVQSGECTMQGGRPLVVPGQPEDSYLIDKVTGTTLCFGKRMPPLAALSTAKIQTMSDWICSGAPNN